MADMKNVYIILVCVYICILETYALDGKKVFVLKWTAKECGQSVVSTVVNMCSLQAGTVKVAKRLLPSEKGLCFKGILFFCEVPRSRRYGRTAILIVQHCDGD
jgi:hypothetical protein